METLKAPYWFSAHLHVKFAALHKHDHSPTKLYNKPLPPLNAMRGAGQHSAQPKVTNPDELLIESDGEDQPSTVAKAIPNPDELHIDSEEEGTPPDPKQNGNTAHNPDELMIEDDDEDETVAASLIHPTKPQPGLTDMLDNPTVDESVSLLEAALAPTVEDDGDVTAPGDPAVVFPPEVAINSAAPATKFLALSKCLPGQDFLQVPTAGALCDRD